MTEQKLEEYYKNIKNIIKNYNIEFLCTYRNFDDDYHSNLCYQIQLLQAFNMNKYDEFILSKNIETIYIFLQNYYEITDIMKILKEKYSTTNIAFFIQDNDDVLFQIIFSHNYFDIFHKCLCNYVKDKLNSNFNETKKYFDELKLLVVND